MKYSVKDTVRWMLDEAIAVAAEDKAADARGVMRAKSKARRAQEASRIGVLAEVLWNAKGRPGDLDEFIAGRMGDADE